MMAALAFDALRYARWFREAGSSSIPVPEAQAGVQAELMTKAFGFYAGDILTRDYFEARLDARFAQGQAWLGE